MSLRSIVLLTVAAAWLAGCAAHRVDLAERNQLKVEGSSTRNIAVPKPSVWQEDGNTIVYGRVQRARGAFGIGAGHTHVRVQLPGGIIEEQWVGWSPKSIPHRGPRLQGLHYSTYRAVFPWVVPPDSSVRVWVCFDDHPSIPGGNVPTTAPAV